MRQVLGTEKQTKIYKESAYMVALATHSTNFWETGGEGVPLIQLAYNGA